MLRVDNKLLIIKRTYHMHKKSKQGIKWLNRGAKPSQQYHLSLQHINKQ